jgi:hypothetical protein
MMPKVFAEWLRIKYGRMAAAMGRGANGAGAHGGTNGSGASRGVAQPAAPGAHASAATAAPERVGANGNGAGNGAAPEPMGFSEPIHVPLASIRARAQAARAANDAQTSGRPTS